MLFPVVPPPPSICAFFPGSLYCYSGQESHRNPEVPLCSLLSASSDAEISLENKKTKPLITFCFPCFATWLGAEIKAQHGGHGSPYSVSCSELLVKSCQEVTWPRVRGLFVFAAARGDLRPEPGLGHCFLGPAALPASAVLGCRPFPSCLGLSDGGECGGSGEDPGASSSSSSSWELCCRGWEPEGYGGGWQQGHQGSQKWDCLWSRRGNMKTHLWIWSSGWLARASCWTPVSLIRYFPHQHY